MSSNELVCNGSGSQQLSRAASRFRAPSAGVVFQKKINGEEPRHTESLQLFVDPRRANPQFSELSESGGASIAVQNKPPMASDDLKQAEPVKSKEGTDVRWPCGMTRGGGLFVAVCAGTNSVSLPMGSSNSRSATVVQRARNSEWRVCACVPW